MMETRTPLSPAQEDLRDRLARLVDSDGSWSKDAAADLSANEWRRWFALRLQGKDPYFGYDRDEFPDGASLLFRDLFRDLPSLDTTEAAEGLYWYLRSLEDQFATHPGIQLRVAIDLVSRVRPRHLPEDSSSRQDLRDLLRRWIGGTDEYPESLLLEGRTDPDDESVSPKTLHRRCLFALATLQRQRNEDDFDVWTRWFDEMEFASAAFSGMGLSVSESTLRQREDAPAEWVARLFEYAHAIEEAGGSINLRYPLESLYAGDLDRETLKWYFWDEVHAMDNPEQRWKALKNDLLQRTDAHLISYTSMQHRTRHRDANGSGDDEVTAGTAASTGWSIFHPA